MRNQPKEHIEKSLPIKQTTIQNYRKTERLTERKNKKERKKEEEEEDEAEDEKEDKEKRQRVERLTKRAEQGREKRWRHRANCEGRAEMRDEGHERKCWVFRYFSGLQ